MLGLDTNVLVRFLVRDDELQFARAKQRIKREVASGGRIFVSLLVLLETEWVLRSRYALTKPEILAAFSSLLEARELGIEDEAALEEALVTWRSAKAEFADCLIGARNRRLGCRATVTFDSDAMKLATFSAV